MTNKLFKEICLEQARQTKVVFVESIHLFFYISCLLEEKADSPLAIPQDGVKFSDLFDLSTKEKLERNIKHLQSWADKVNKLSSALQSKIDAYGEKHIQIPESKISQEFKDISADLDDDDEEDIKIKRQLECSHSDRGDLSRIHTIDMSDYFSFRRIVTFSYSISTLYNSLAVSSIGLKERIDDFHILEKYKEILSDRHNQLIGYWSAKTSIDLNESLKALHTKRTEKSTEAKRRKRKIKERYVLDEYLRMIGGEQLKNKDILAKSSENKLAETIKERIIGDLKNKDINDISNKTIIDILRKRDKNKIRWYPWEEKNNKKI